MEKPRVYIETTIPSAYFDERRAPEMVARREDTRRWWATAGDRYAKVTSAEVREELERGPSHRRGAWVKLIESLPLLRRKAVVREIAGTYIHHKVMPSYPLGDALHLALASYYRCDYLLTWNFKHPANPRKFGHIQRVNVQLGLFVPRIVTPSELLEKDHE
jgi:predicted nucleic acid-binding protein